MTTRSQPPNGAPCWIDLWTSDVAGSREFYAAVFGWEAQEPDPTHGGYFMFTRAGEPAAGGMGDMGDIKAQNVWGVYLASDDIVKTVASAEAEGATVVVTPMAVDQFGQQAVLIDPTGARIGAWQPGTFPGFTVMNEHGTPSWFELHTRDREAAVRFYTSAFRWETEDLPGEHGIGYTTLRDPAGEGMLAGILDASGFLPEGAGASWAVYFEVDDIDATLVTVAETGGTVVAAAEDTPFGRIATAADPAGAVFKLRTGG